LILKVLPEAIFQFSLDVQLVFVRSQIIVLSVVPFNVIPPPSAVILVGVVTDPSSTFLSSTLIVVELIVVVVPLIVKLPVTTRSLLNVAVPPPKDDPKLILVVDPAAAPVPILMILVVAVAVAPVEIFSVEAAVLLYPSVKAVADPKAVNVAPESIEVVNVGDVPNTREPEPVSSEIIPKSSAEVVAANALNLLAV